MSIHLQATKIHRRELKIKCIFVNWVRHVANACDWMVISFPFTFYLLLWSLNSLVIRMQACVYDDVEKTDYDTDYFSTFQRSNNNC